MATDGARAADGSGTWVALVFTTCCSPKWRVLIPSTDSEEFRASLRTLGYVQGQNLVLAPRSAEGRFERFPEIIRELVSIKIDVIVTVANPMTRPPRTLTGRFLSSWPTA